MAQFQLLKLLTLYFDRQIQNGFNSATGFLLLVRGCGISSEKTTADVHMPILVGLDVLPVEIGRFISPGAPAKLDELLVFLQCESFARKVSTGETFDRGFESSEQTVHWAI